MKGKSTTGKFCMETENLCTAILQRVHSASVTVDQKLISQIGKGILVFAAVSKEDSREDVESMAAKVLKMRMWDDDNGGKVTMVLIPTDA